ncbi:MAG: glycine cleavage system aminomethyltransferase GcvT [Porphyromonas sp.]|nr:glycine cleavage system aminomethyltransferase GcvT [Porphyromonas sp.]
MKTTPFTSIHESLGAKMAPFAGFNMPIEYSGITDEHLNVIENMGVFDVSHMGALWVSGPNALPFLQNVCSNDISKVAVGKAQYNYMPNDKGGIVDDFILYHYEESKYMLAVNASNIEKDFAWLQKHASDGVILENGSDNIGILAVQGPKAKAVLQTLTPVNLDNIPFYAFEVGEFAGVKDVIISNTGYTGAGGFELYFYPENGVTIWNALFEAGKDAGIKPTGLGARDTLRLEMGYCLYGNDIDETTNPLEAGLGWVTKLTDEKKNLPSREILEATKINGPEKKLTGFEMVGKGIPRHGYEIANEEGKIIGHVTSGTMSPALKKGIGLGYLEKAHTSPDSKIFVVVRGKQIEAKVVKLPFRK